jgi:hypothetical protein
VASDSLLSIDTPGEGVRADQQLPIAGVRWATVIPASRIQAREVAGGAHLVRIGRDDAAPSWSGVKTSRCSGSCERPDSML